jgi:ATP-dependent DNA helicase RecG
VTTRSATAVRKPPASATPLAPPTADTPLSQAGIGAATTVKRLAKLGIVTVRDLLFHLPRRYDDFTRPMSLRAIRDEPPDGPVTATVRIVDLMVHPGFRRRVQRTVAVISDDSGEGEAVWFGRQYIERRIHVGDEVSLAGKVDVRGWTPRFQNPEFGAADGASLHAGRIVPVYPLTAGVSAQVLRKVMREALDAVGAGYREYLPEDVRSDTDLVPVEVGEALEAAHYPPDFDARNRALRRLAFDELLALQLGMVARDRQRRGAVGDPLEMSDARFREAVAGVEASITASVRRRLAASEEPQRRAEAESFRATLTDDQLSALAAVRSDLRSERPMLRLLQGDVGSGKTAVAAIALCIAADAERQGALLAPTDLLARQHAATLSSLLQDLGHEVVLLTGSLPAADRRAALEAIAAPPVTMPGGRSVGRVVVGTHALMQERVVFHDLALAVVDEQHRFGVAEREALSAKGRSPHVLLMTATPIPQTLARIVHADLDVSDIRTPPAGRERIRTGVRATAHLTGTDGKDPGLGTWPLVAREIRLGRRAFVVVPLVEEDEESGGRSVEQAAAMLREALPEAARRQGLEDREERIGIVHGQLPPRDRDAVMEAFRAGELDVLVGTTVLEVGVDVPEASVMVILDADRFGVAQLHQLRGRVGRGEAASYCVLVSDRYPHGQPKERDTEEQAAVRARLSALVETQDGFRLAELDLEQRREGELLGLTQSGLPPFRVASLSTKKDLELSARAREVADTLVDAEGRLRQGLTLLGEELRDGWLARVGAGDIVSRTDALADDSPRGADVPGGERA